MSPHPLCRRAGPALAAALVALLVTLFLPSDLIAVRSKLLQGMVGSYETGHWDISVTSTNQYDASTTSAASAFAKAYSDRTQAILMAMVTGQSLAPVTAAANATYSGTWTFRWLPAGPDDWPTATAIQSISSRMYACYGRAGTGWARVWPVSGNAFADVTLPSANPPVLESPPADVQVDNSIPDLTVTVRTTDHHASNGTADTRVDRRARMVITNREYAAAWFRANFLTPSDIVLTFTVPSTQLGLATEFTGDMPASGASASALAVDYFGFPIQPTVTGGGSSGGGYD